jgi:hypothetical protein
MRVVDAQIHVGIHHVRLEILSGSSNGGGCGYNCLLGYDAV